METLYKVVAVDPLSGLELCRSDLHPWVECETVYSAYAEDYPAAHVLIVPVA